MSEADRLHEALCTVSERLAGQLEGSRFERRDGYEFLAFPMFPLPSFNGIWAETDDAANELESAVAEAEELGPPIGVMVRDGRTPAVAQRARELGFSIEEPTPGMVMRPGELQVPDSELDILQIKTADGLAQALAVAATGFEIPGELLSALYLLEVAELEGIEYYLALLLATPSTTPSASSTLRHHPTFAGAATARSSPRTQHRPASTPAQTSRTCSRARWESRCIAASASGM